MSERSDYIKDFYNGECIRLSTMSCRLGEVALQDTMQLQLSEGQQAMSVGTVLDRVAKSAWKTIICNGYELKLGLFNEDTATTDEAITFFSSFNSNYRNEGNVAQAGYRAACRPHTPLVYVPTFDFERALSGRELDYAQRTGRLTQHDGEKVVPLPTVQDLIDGVQRLEKRPTRSRSESAGNIVQRAFCAFQPEGQMTHMASDAPLQIVDLQSEESRAFRLYGLEAKNRLVNARRSRDPWRMNDELRTGVRATRHDLYGTDPEPMESGERFRILRASAVIAGHGINGMNPFDEDLRIYFDRHPESSYGLVMGTNDPLSSTRALSKNLQWLLRATAERHPRATMNIVRLPQMSHGASEFYPWLYEEVIGKLLELSSAA